MIKKIDLIAYFTNSTSDIKSYENDFPKITHLLTFSETKGIYLLESLLIIIKKIPNVKLDIVGRGHSEKFFFSLIDKGFEKFCKLFGWADKQMIDNYLSRASVVAFPSIYPESFGIVALRHDERSSSSRF